MKLKFFTSLVLVFTSILVNAQSNSIIVNPFINLPKDSIESKILVSSLNDFLSASQQPNDENKFVLESQKIETNILLDEINGIEKSGKYQDDHFYKPYLTNVVPLKDSQYLIQLSFIGMHEQTPFLRASFELIAHKKGNSFLFSSMLIANTKNWKQTKVGYNIFHYQSQLNTAKAQEFTKYAALYDKKLKSLNKVTELYCTDNLITLEKLIGVEYKSDYNGRTTSIWASILSNKKLIVFGNHNADFNDFDPHDLWHERLGMVIPRNKVNRAVDEACAYLYGGSWGMSWKEIFKAFKEQIANNKNADWMAIKETPVYFKTKGFNNSADYIVTALLVQKIEKEKGFAGVWELLNVGPSEKGNEKYYATLQKLTGISKANYNEKIWELINQEK